MFDHIPIVNLAGQPAALVAVGTNASDVQAGRDIASAIAQNTAAGASSASSLVVNASSAPAGQTLIVVGTVYDNPIVLTLYREYGISQSTALDTGPIVEAFGTDRVLISGSSYGEVQQAANMFIADLQGQSTTTLPTTTTVVTTTTIPTITTIQTTTSVPTTTVSTTTVLTTTTIPTTTTIQTTTSVPTTTVSTTTSVPATTSAISYPPGTFRLTVRSGWNLISVPLQYVTSANTTCGSGSLGALWQMQQGSYSQAGSIYGGKGYWLYSSSDCVLDLAGPALSSASQVLSTGWNLVGSPGSNTGIESVSGGCSIIDGPYSYNSSSGAYQSTTMLSPGNGYFVKVSGACTFGVGTAASPPSPP